MWYNFLTEISEYFFLGWTPQWSCPTGWEPLYDSMLVCIVINTSYFPLGNLERECVEEICDHEEAREVFEQQDTTVRRHFVLMTLDTLHGPLITKKYTILVIRVLVVIVLIVTAQLTT